MVVLLQFKELAQAYEVLSDLEKPEIYDRYGDDAHREGMGGGVEECTIHSTFSNRSLGLMIAPLEVGPGMIQQMHHPCNDCKGTGKTINGKDRCPQFKGEKVVQEKKVLEVRVEKGMQNGPKITFPGEADEAPDTVTGDIIFVLQHKEHPNFKRKGDGLFYEHTLTLIEALCGFQFVLTQLDNGQLLIKSNPGEVVKPDSFKAINDEGMLIYQRPFMKGKLYIHFSVEFPNYLNPDLEDSLNPDPGLHLPVYILPSCQIALP